MMTDETTFAMMYSHCCHPKQDATSFKGSGKEVAAFIMGVMSADPYANFDDRHPWSRPLQIGRLMQTLYDAPGPVSLGMALATMEGAWTPYQRDNLIKGFGFVMSDYVFNIFERATKQGIEDHTTRTYHMLKHILELGRLIQILKSPNKGIELESVLYSSGHANRALLPMCNADVDAHPMARTMLQRFIEETQQLIVNEVENVA